MSRIYPIGADGLRTVAFNTDGLPSKDRFTFMRDGAQADTVPFDIVRLTDTPFSAEGRVLGTMDLYLTRLRASSQVLVRGRPEIARGARGTTSIMLVNRGTLVLDQAGQTVVGLPGDLVVVHEDVPFRIAFREICDFTSVQIGTDGIPADIRTRAPLVLSPRLSPLATVTAAYLRSLPSDATALAGMTELATTQLSALALHAADWSGPSARMGRRVFDAVQHIIEAEIGNPDLSSKLICDRLGLSRTALFEAVAAEGHTLAGLVLERRLSACIGDMARVGRTETLATISGRWGFRDQSTFTRAFRRRFGEVPKRWQGSRTD